MLKVEINRGHLLESTHYVHARVETGDGQVLFNTSADFDFFPRSAIKPFQSYLLLESGAFQKYDLDLRHLALASASHAGEAEHTDLVTAWLSKLNLPMTALQCGTHWPNHQEAANLLRANKSEPSAKHNNCSGKHTGFLTVCAHLNLPIENYHQANHPLQQKLKAILERELECELKDYGIDGCSIPAFRLSFYKMSRAFAKMAKQAHENPKSNAGLVFEAFKNYPQLTSGNDQYCTHLMRKNPGRLLVKGGAEGVLVGIMPEKQISILVKCQDGSHRGSQYAFNHLVEKYFGSQIALSSTLTNWVGTEVGDVRVVEV